MWAATDEKPPYGLAGKSASGLQAALKACLDAEALWNSKYRLRCYVISGHQITKARSLTLTVLGVEEAFAPKSTYPKDTTGTDYKAWAFHGDLPLQEMTNDGHVLISSSWFEIA